MLAPGEAVLLIVATGLVMHSIPVWRLRRELRCEGLAPVAVPGISVVTLVL